MLVFGIVVEEFVKLSGLSLLHDGTHRPEADHEDDVGRNGNAIELLLSVPEVDDVGASENVLVSLEHGVSFRMGWSH